MALAALIPLYTPPEPGEDLGPYVPAVDDAGRVVFTTLHAGGSSSVRLVSDAGVEVLARLEPPARFTSHPDHDGRGAVVVCARLGHGRTALVRVRGGGLEPLVTAGGAFTDIAPTGPTCVEGGAVGFRAALAGGGEGAYVHVGGEVREIAASPAYHAFFGLPVVASDGAAGIRADGERGPVVVVRPRVGAAREVFGGIGELGAFPCLADDGGGGVAARRPGGWTYVRTRGDDVVDSFPPGSMGHVRGGLLVAGGLLALGAPLFGSEVTDFALNPVSGSDAGWLAVRVTLADGRRVIARTEAPLPKW